MTTSIHRFPARHRRHPDAPSLDAWFTHITDWHACTGPVRRSIVELQIEADRERHSGGLTALMDALFEGDHQP